MNTQQIIQASAKVIRITELSPGNLYKRFDLESTYDIDKTIFGIVRNIHNDGENSIIEATEYKRSYSNIDISYKNISGKQDVTIFPCELEEFVLEFDKVRSSYLSDIERKKEEIDELEKKANDLEKLMSGETQKNLSVCSYKELSQLEYNEKKAKLKAAESEF